MKNRKVIQGGVPLKVLKKQLKKPHEKPIKEAAVAPPAPVVRSPSRSPPVSPVRTPSPLSSPASTVPSSPVILTVIGPVAMGTVEEIKNTLIESNRVAAMPIPQFYGKKGEKLIGTVYRNYHRPALIITFIFPDLLPKILRTSSQERACPTRTYACLIKHYSK